MVDRLESAVIPHVLPFPLAHAENEWTAHPCQYDDGLWQYFSNRHCPQLVAVWPRQYQRHGDYQREAPPTAAFLASPFPGVSPQDLVRLAWRNTLHTEGLHPALVRSVLGATGLEISFAEQLARVLCLSALELEAEVALFILEYQP